MVNEAEENDPEDGERVVRTEVRDVVPQVRHGFIVTVRESERGQIQKHSPWTERGDHRLRRLLGACTQRPDGCVGRGGGGRRSSTVTVRRRKRRLLIHWRDLFESQQMKKRVLLFLKLLNFLFGDLVSLVNYKNSTNKSEYII